jgi:hypothetical protein
MTRRTAPPSPLTPPGHVARYRDRIFDAKCHDPYEPPGKYAGPTRCPHCGAVYERGRWRWGNAPPGSHVGDCPACRRTRDKLPAGVVTLDGPFAASQGAELIRIVRNEAAHEAKEHPMHRIMRIDERDGRIEISTTDIHLPQRIGEAVKRSHHGELTVRYASDEYSVRAHWNG